MKSISILGCGWLGLPLGKYFTNQGYQVKGSTTRSEKLSELSIANIKPYLINLEPELKADPEDFFDSDILIINLPPRNQNGISGFHFKQLGAIHDFAIHHVRNILFISSTGVYPNTDGPVREEDADRKCISRGGVSIVEAEEVFSLDPALKTTIIRFGGLYGPGRHPGRFLAGKTNLPGGNNPVNMIHLEDCIGVIHKIIQLDIWGETFNACSPDERTRESFYQEASADLGNDPPIFSDEPAPFKRVICDKLISMTGYHFRY
ncbi:MAG: SDR family oxidoreductase [Bacteroidota bacterium]